MNEPCHNCGAPIMRSRRPHDDTWRHALTGFIYCDHVHGSAAVATVAPEMYQEVLV